MKRAFRSIRGLFVSLLVCGCVAQEPVGVREDAIALPGMWAPPPSTLAIGDRHSIRRDSSPLISDGGYCTSTNPWTCSCRHPACSSGLPGTLELASFLRRRFPQITSAGGFECCRQNTGDTRYLSVHSIGRAIDLSIRVASSTEADNTAGDPVANWLLENAQDIGVQIIVWDRASWNSARSPGSRLNPYTGPIPHIDHIHVELNLDGANRRTPFFTSGASGGGATCAARCEGTVMIQADCRTGDCGVFGTECVADPTPRCVVPGCPPRGTGSICLDDSQILRCTDGLPDGPPGNCGAFGSFCSTAGVGPTEARCVVALCVGGPTVVPEPHVGCSITTGRLLDCDADGRGTEVPCPEGQICSVASGVARCEAPLAECPVPAVPGPPFDDRMVCLSTGQVARCFQGNIVSAERCGTGGVCSTVGGPAHCARSVCFGPGGALREGEVCTRGGDVAICDTTGTFASVRPCGAGEVCAELADGARCAPGERPGDEGGEDVPAMGVGDADGGGAGTADAGAFDGGSDPRDSGAGGGALEGGCTCRAGGVGARAPYWLGLVGLSLATALGLRRRRGRSSCHE